MKPGTNAMKVIAKSANSGCVSSASDSIHGCETMMLNISQASAANIAMPNFTGTET